MVGGFDYNTFGDGCVDKGEGTGFFVLFYEDANVSYVTGTGSFPEKDKVSNLQVCVALYGTALVELGLGVCRDVVSEVLEDV